MKKYVQGVFLFAPIIRNIEVTSDSPILINLVSIVRILGPGIPTTWSGSQQNKTHCHLTDQIKSFSNQHNYSLTIIFRDKIHKFS